MTNPSQTQPIQSPATTLQSLKPVTLLPERYSERPQTITALQRVDPFVSCESISCSGRRQSTFSLGVSYKLSRRRIPVAVSRGLNIYSTRPQSSVSDTNADIQVERTFTEFRRLRDAVYYAANSDHGLSACKYCRAMNDLVLLGESTPHKSMRLLQKPEAQSASLSQFLQELIQLAVQTKPMRCGELCSGQQRIPELLCEFLQLLEPESSTETAVIASAFI